MNKQYTLDDITSVLKTGFALLGNIKDKYFTNVQTIYEANEESLVWVNSKKNIDVAKTRAHIVICDEKVRPSDELLATKCFIVVENPKLAYLRLVEKYFVELPPFGVHPTAAVHSEAKIHPKTYIGPFTYIGRCTIGEGTIIFGHCHIYDKVEIGRNVMIHAGTVIGADGFGYSRNEDGELEKFPHIGGVVIEDDVEIGANTCVDRGTLGNTVIRESAKIDNLVHIAHNCVIGKHSAVIANAMVGGSTEIGDYGWIAPSAALMNGITVGKNATIGLGAVLTKNVPDGETWAGVPAQPIKDFVAIQKKLKELK
jgi:UDP-3-O-[3-hydroxymyristoyl] glucosamine N-acyltransferase